MQQKIIKISEEETHTHNCRTHRKNNQFENKNEKIFNKLSFMQNCLEK